MGSQQNNEWSTERPTEPGWYLALEAGGEAPELVEVCSRSFGALTSESDVFWEEGRTAWLRIESPDLDGAQKALDGEP